MEIVRIDEAEIVTPTTEHKYYLGAYYVKKVQANAKKDYDIYKYVRLRPTGSTLALNDAMTWDTDSANEYQVRPTGAVNEEVIGIWEGPASAVADASVDNFLFIRCGGKTIVKTTGVAIGNVLVSTAVSGQLTFLDIASGSLNAISNRITAFTATAGGTSNVMICLM